MINKKHPMRFNPLPDGTEPAASVDGVKPPVDRPTDPQKSDFDLIERYTGMLEAEHSKRSAKPKQRFAFNVFTTRQRPGFAGLGVSSRKKVKIVRPPGSFLLSVTSFVYSKKTFERVFQQAISDMREEYNEAIIANKKWRARFIVIRGNFSVIGAASLHLPVSVVRIVTTFWKVGS